ncbi:MAG TPA: hypothetical protein VIY69_06910 [Candidatus Acidoferrales bacterium]
MAIVRARKKSIQVRTIVLLLAIYGFGGTCYGQIRRAAPRLVSGISQFQLLFPGFGWVRVQGKFYLTRDDGAHWTDITPPGASIQPGLNVYSLFFSDRSHAWMVVDEGEVDDPYAPVRLFATKDGGTTWSTLPFKRSDYKDLGGIVCPISIQFLDDRTGLMLWGVPHGQGAIPPEGLLFITHDGGTTWDELGNPPDDGKLTFITSRVGWMTDSTADFDLWLTRDGSETWEKASLPTPLVCSAPVGSPCSLSHYLPKFKDENNGVLPLGLHLGGENLLLTYTTHDSGKSWEPGEEIDLGQGNANAFSIVDMHLDVVFSIGMPEKTITAHVNGVTRTLSVLTGAEMFKGKISEMSGISSAQFADDLHAWITYSWAQCTQQSARVDRFGNVLPCSQSVLRSDLVSTDDGWKTLKMITPSAASETVQQLP